MDLVDEQHVVGFEVGQDCREIPGALQDRAGGLSEADAHFVGYDMCQRCLAEPGRAENQDVIERFTATSRGLDKNAHLLLDRRLPDILVEHTRPNRTIKGAVLRPRFGAGDAVMFDARHRLSLPPGEAQGV